MAIRLPQIQIYFTKFKESFNRSHSYTNVRVQDWNPLIKKELGAMLNCGSLPDNTMSDTSLEPNVCTITINKEEELICGEEAVCGQFSSK